MFREKADNILKASKLIDWKKESFTFDTYDILKEDATHDEYIRKFARYVPSKICQALEQHLTKEELSMIKEKSIKDLSSVNSDSFDKLFPYFTINVVQENKEYNFPALTVRLLPANNKQLSAFTIEYYGLYLDLYVITQLTKVNLGLLKRFIVNKENLDHEIIHFIDSFKTKAYERKVNNTEYNKYSHYYYNFPQEYHAYSQQVISKLHDTFENDFDNEILTNLLSARSEKDFFDQLSNIIGNEYKVNFIDNLNIKNKRNFIKRIRNYILEMRLNENAIYSEQYEAPYMEAWDEKTFETIFDPVDEALYIKLLYESLMSSKI